MFWTKDPTPPAESPSFELTSELANLPSKKRYRAVRRYRDLLFRAEAAERNAHEPYPRTECPDCHALCKPKDLGWLYPKLCTTCDARRIEDLVSAIAERIGNKKARKLLKRLGREDIPGA